MTRTKQEAATEAATSHPLPDHPKVSDTVIFNPPPAVVNLVGPGAFRTGDHRYYFNGQGPVPGVTSVLDVLMKWDLVNWKVKQAVLSAVELYQPGLDLDELVTAVKAAIDEKRDRQAKIGTGVHLLADLETRAATDATAASQIDSKAGLVPDEWIPYLDAYRGFLGRYSASSIVSSEKMVWSAAGYGGTYDFLMQLPNEYHGQNVCPGYDSLHNLGGPCLWLVDVKTAKGAYPENGLQLAAYRWADGIILPGDPKLYPMPVIHHTGLLHLRPDIYTDTGYRLIEYPVTVEDDYYGFLGALQAYEWRSKKRFLKKSLNTVT